LLIISTILTLFKIHSCSVREIPVFLRWGGWRASLKYSYLCFFFYTKRKLIGHCNLCLFMFYFFYSIYSCLFSVWHLTEANLDSLKIKTKTNWNYLLMSSRVLIVIMTICINSDRNVLQLLVCSSRVNHYIKKVLWCLWSPISTRLGSFISSENEIHFFCDILALVLWPFEMLKILTLLYHENKKLEYWI